MAFSQLRTVLLDENDIMEKNFAHLQIDQSNHYIV